MLTEGEILYCWRLVGAWYGMAGYHDRWARLEGREASWYPAVAKKETKEVLARHCVRCKSNCTWANPLPHQPLHTHPQGDGCEAVRAVLLLRD